MPKFVVLFFERKASRYPPQQPSGTILVGNPVKAHDYDVFFDHSHEEKVSRRIRVLNDYHYCIIVTTNCTMIANQCLLRSSLHSRMNSTMLIKDSMVASSLKPKGEA